MKQDKAEQMAEKYAQTVIGDYLPIEEDKETMWMTAYDGYLAGIEAERKYVRDNAFTSMKEQESFPFGKLHKVADGDLPKQDGHTCFSVEVLANNNKIVYYKFSSGKWFCGNKEVKVIAWYELPKFSL